jgi:hypothetical protein
MPFTDPASEQAPHKQIASMGARRIRSGRYSPGHIGAATGMGETGNGKRQA